MKSKMKLFTTMVVVGLLTAQVQSVFAETPPPSKVSLNKSDAKALMQVNGMTAYKAHAIVAYRSKNGAFKNAGDLEKVNGFKHLKPDAMKALTDHLSVD